MVRKDLVRGVCFLLHLFLRNVLRCGEAPRVFWVVLEEREVKAVLFEDRGLEVKSKPQILLTGIAGTVFPEFYAEGVVARLSDLVEHRDGHFEGPSCGNNEARLVFISSVEIVVVVPVIRHLFVETD